MNTDEKMFDTNDADFHELILLAWWGERPHEPRVAGKFDASARGNARPTNFSFYPCSSVFIRG